MNYYIATDSASMEITAKDIDAAARRYDDGMGTMDELVSYVTENGGWITVEEDGKIVVKAGER
jgi:hypothetical protein